jgi:lipopolysaccharide transport system ATP-binding protein
MSDTVLVRVEGVSKKYCRDLKKSLWYGVKDLCRDVTGVAGDQNILRPHEFWALEDISFTLKKGESIGLIGRNGAGKTTLLKLINGLIKSTKGKIAINGTIGALIALGTGFNPILTGRENIKIAGAVLGFSEREINERMDEILDFSEIGDFIDSPVRSYSSGMLVRLGFSVAIQLNPDILLVDEVLAVGDLSFSVKCHKKITEYRNSGGSMILVSHYMHNVRIHCDRGIWLDSGRMMTEGTSAEACNKFEMFIGRTGIQRGSEVYSDKSIRMVRVNYPETVTSSEGFELEFTVESKRYIKKPIIVFAIFDVRGQHLISNYSHFEGFFPSFIKGYTTIKVSFGYLPLSSGIYSITIVLHENEVGNHIAFFQNRFIFEVQNEGSDFGLLRFKPTWSVAT